MIKPLRILALTVVIANGFFIFNPAQASEFVVQLKARPQALAHFASDVNSELKEISKSNRIYLVKRNLIERQEYGLAQLRANPDVLVAENNIHFKLAKAPNDTLYNKQWAFRNLERIDLDLQAEKAWDITTGSDKVVVAIVDTGIVIGHEDLSQNIWTNEVEKNGVEGVDDDGNGFVDDIHGWDFYGNDNGVNDVEGHGTMCAGIIGAQGNNGYGMAGVNWNVKLMPVRFASNDGDGTLANAIQGIEYAVNNHADIILTAWTTSDQSSLLQEAIEDARTRNILVVAAAGNDGDDNDVTPAYPSSFDSENILSVAALNQTGALSDYSNYGRRSVDVGAPGVNIVTTSLWDYENDWSGGTSAAASYVAGIAALIKSQEPDITYFDLKDRIVLLAKQIASLRGKMVSPGMANAYYSLINQVSPPDTSDPSGWMLLEKTFETSHPYSNNENTVYQIQVPNAKHFAVLFDQFETEDGYDYLTIKDSMGREVAKLTGNQSGKFSPAVVGDTMTLEFTSDVSATKFGFLITKIYYEE